MLLQRYGDLTVSYFFNFHPHGFKWLSCNAASHTRKSRPSCRKKTGSLWNTRCSGGDLIQSSRQLQLWVKLLEQSSNMIVSVSWSWLVSLSPISVRHRPAHHLRGPGRDADGPAGPALPCALHPAHQPHCGAVPQGIAPVLEWKWICGEYQFDMTAYHWRTKKA